MGIGAAGQVNIDQAAGPIGEALIMTALGLLVAIPDVLGYNALLRGKKPCRTNSTDLHTIYTLTLSLVLGFDAHLRATPPSKEPPWPSRHKTTRS